MEYTTPGRSLRLVDDRHPFQEPGRHRHHLARRRVQARVERGAGGDRLAAIRDYVATFLDANVNAKPESRLLSGPSADYPDVEVTTQTQSQCTAADTSLPH